MPRPSANNMSAAGVPPVADDVPTTYAAPSQAMLQSAQAFMIDCGLSPSSARAYVATLRRFFRETANADRPAVWQERIDSGKPSTFAPAWKRWEAFLIQCDPSDWPQDASAARERQMTLTQSLGGLLDPSALAEGVEKGSGQGRGGGILGTSIQSATIRATLGDRVLTALAELLDDGLSADALQKCVWADLRRVRGARQIHLHIGEDTHTFDYDMGAAFAVLFDYAHGIGADREFDADRPLLPAASKGTAPFPSKAIEDVIRISLRRSPSRSGEQFLPEPGGPDLPDSPAGTSDRHDPFRIDEPAELPPGFPTPQQSDV